MLPIPKGGENGQNSATLGGWQWAVSAYTKHPEAAVQLLKIVTSAEAQKKAFEVVGVSPSRVALYEDPEILAKAPFLPEFKPVFANATPRPASATKGQFPKVSKTFYNAAYDVLSGRTTGEKAVKDLEAKLKRIKGREWK